VCDREKREKERKRERKRKRERERERERVCITCEPWSIQFISAMQIIFSVTGHFFAKEPLITGK